MQALGGMNPEQAGFITYMTVGLLLTYSIFFSGGHNTKHIRRVLRLKSSCARVT